MVRRVLSGIIIALFITGLVYGQSGWDKPIGTTYNPGHWSPCLKGCEVVKTKPMTRAQVMKYQPSVGFVYFDIDSLEYFVYNGSKWVSLGSGVNGGGGCCNQSLSYDDKDKQLTLVDDAGTLSTYIDISADYLADNSIGDLNDVIVDGSQEEGMVLKWTGTVWKPDYPGGDSIWTRSGNRVILKNGSDKVLIGSQILSEDLLENLTVTNNMTDGDASFYICSDYSVGSPGVARLTMRDHSYVNHIVAKDSFWTFTSNSSKILFETGAEKAIYIDKKGRVAINTDYIDGNATARLLVNGNATIDGKLGIGIHEPSGILHVHSTSQSTLIKADGSADAYIELTTNQDAGGAHVGLNLMFADGHKCVIDYDGYQLKTNAGTVDFGTLKVNQNEVTAYRELVPLEGIKPNYDSDWLDVSYDTTLSFDHGLGSIPRRAEIYLGFLDTTTNKFQITAINTGWYDGTNWHGIDWSGTHITMDSVFVHLGQSISDGCDFNKARIILWK